MAYQDKKLELSQLLIVKIENVKYNKRAKDLIISISRARNFLFKLFLPYVKLTYSKVINNTNKICDELML